MSLSAGTRLGAYEITAPLGSGGMGAVYKAKDTRLDRTVAIKVLAPHLAADPQFRERFDREARAISALDHPHICALYDVGEQDGTAFLVMQYLEGETLADAAIPLGGSWNGENLIIFAPTLTSPILKIDAAGGASAAVTTLTPGEVGHLRPVFWTLVASFYLAADNVLTVTPIKGRDAGLEVGAPRARFEIHTPIQPGYLYAFSSDGQRFLVNTDQAVQAPISVVVNWTAGLKK